MDYQKAHSDYDNKYLCLEEKYLKTMELKLKAIEERHFLDMKQDWRSQCMHIQETQAQTRVLDDKCQQYIQKQQQALAQQFKRVLQQQHREIKDKSWKNNEVGDQSLDEKYRRYKQERELELKAKDPSYFTSVEELCVHKQFGHGQYSSRSRYGTNTYSTPSVDGPRGYYADDEISSGSQTICQPNYKTYSTTVSSAATFHIGGTTNTPQSRVTRSPSVNTSSCSASMPQSPTYRSSVGNTDVSGPVEHSIENKPQSERTNWFTSFINEQIPHIFNQLRSSDIPQMCDKQQLKEFMAFLEEQNVLESLQEVAEKAVVKLMNKTVMPVDITMCKLGLKDEVCKTLLENQDSKVTPPPPSVGATETASPSIHSGSSKAPYYLSSPCSDSEVSEPLSSLEDSISDMESRPPSGFWDHAPLLESSLPACRKEDIQCWKSKSPSCTMDLTDTSPQNSCPSSAERSEKTWTSFHLPELLFIGSVCSSIPDILTEKSSYAASADTSCFNSDLMNNSVLESPVYSSTDRYTQFLEILEKKKVFPALEEVVNKAINLLMKYERKEKTSSNPTTSDSSPLKVCDQNNKPIKVTSPCKTDQSVCQVYNVKFEKEVEPQPVQVPLPDSPQTLHACKPVSPPRPRSVPRQASPPPPTRVPEQPSQESRPSPIQQPISEVTETDLETAFTMSTEPSPLPIVQTETTSMTSEFITTMAPSTATGDMELTNTSREMEPTTTSKSIRTISTGKTKNSPASSRTTATTNNTKSTNSKKRAKARPKKGSDSIGSKELSVLQLKQQARVKKDLQYKQNSSNQQQCAKGQGKGREGAPQGKQPGRSTKNKTTLQGKSVQTRSQKKAK